MRSTGGRCARAGVVGTPTAVGFAALVASLLLAACSGGEDAPSASAGSDPGTGASAESGSDDGVDEEAARLADLLRRLELSWTEDLSYTFSTRAQGTFVASAGGDGSFRRGRIQQRSTWRAQTADGEARWQFAFNSTTASLAGAGLDTRPGFRTIDSSVAAPVEALFGPGVEALPFWTAGISGAADRITELDLDPDGTGDKVAFTLPTGVWMPPGDELPPEAASSTDYELTFDGQKVARIEAVRDDTVIDVRIRYGPFRRIDLPAISYRGP